MEGVITRTQVIAHPLLIAEGFGARVLFSALLARSDETFLEIVRRCAEEEAHRHLQQVSLGRTVERFAAFERQTRDIYRNLSERLPATPEAAHFLQTLSKEEEGHAIILTQVLRDVRRGHVWVESKALHLGIVDALAARLDGYLEESRRGVGLARALEIVEELEGSELNVIFDTLFAHVDQRSRSRFERLFGVNRPHLAYCTEQIAALRLQHGLPARNRIPCPPCPN